MLQKGRQQKTESRNRTLHISETPARRLQRKSAKTTKTKWYNRQEWGASLEVSVVIADPFLAKEADAVKIRLGLG